MRRILTYLSRPKRLSFGNFGDELTLPIFNRLFGVEAVPVPMHRADLISTGSLLDAHSRATWRRKLVNNVFSIRTPLHVWGSGFMLEGTECKWPRPTIVHSVRGELSKARLMFDGAVGDPGILAARLLDKRLDRDAEVALVPHFSDQEVATRLSLPPSWKIVHPDGDVLDVVSRIASAELVVSSSLHGLIVADAFGLPAVWARSTNDLFGKSHFKFFDHASARQQEYNDPLPYDRLMAMRGAELEDLATTSRRDIGQWGDAIVKSFPFT
jgi:pyruvyltransferase